MEIIYDAIFGDLYHDSGLVKVYTLPIFGREFSIELSVCCDEVEEITDSQKDAFKLFEINRSQIIDSIENEVFNYCRENYGLDDRRLLIDTVVPQSIVVRRISSKKNRIIGVVFEASFDEESGIGVLLSNEKIKNIGSQHVAL